MTETHKDELQQLLGIARDLLAQAQGQIGADDKAQALSRTVSYSLSLLDAAMTCFESGRIPGDDAPYRTEDDEIEENERLQTLVLKAALQAHQA